MCFASERLTYHADQNLFEQGEVGDAAFIIVEGTADVVVETKEGPLVVAQFARNDIVGEIAILCDVPRTATVTATTRRADREALLTDNGADHVFIDSGEIAGDVRRVFPSGVDKVLELVGTTTLLDSLQCAARFGSVCMTGMVGNAWEFDRFAPMGAIPSTVNLTTYAGESTDFMATPMQMVVSEVEAGRMTPKIGRVFQLDDIVEAHRCMEDNAAGGKIVVLT